MQARGGPDLLLWKKNGNQTYKGMRAGLRKNGVIWELGPPLIRKGKWLFNGGKSKRLIRGFMNLRNRKWREAASVKWRLSSLPSITFARYSPSPTSHSSSLTIHLSQNRWNKIESAFPISTFKLAILTIAFFITHTVHQTQNHGTYLFLNLWNWAIFFFFRFFFVLMPFVS